MAALILKEDKAVCFHTLLQVLIPNNLQERVRYTKIANLEVRIHRTKNVRWGRDLPTSTARRRRVLKELAGDGRNWKIET